MSTCVGKLEDFEAINVLLDELNKYSVELLPNFFQIGSMSYGDIAKIIESDDSDLILSIHDGEIVGLAEVYFKKTGDLPILVKNEYVYIQNLVVAKEKRGQGIGKELIKTVKDWGRQRDTSIIRLSVIPSNYSAIEFYKNEGFESIMQSMELKVTDSEDLEGDH